MEACHYRLTLLQAGAGYGKSTSLTLLAETFAPVIWYQVTEDDNDPLVFLLHLCHATRKALAELPDLPIPILEGWEGGRGPLPSIGIVDQYLNALSAGLNQPCLLVLDDVHLVESTEIAHLLDRVIGFAPPALHILLAGRSPIKLPNLSRWSAQGEVLTIDQSAFAFDVQEILDLFKVHYDYELSHEEAQLLSSVTEGWAIALQLIWQSLRSGISASIEDALTHQATSLEKLFEILATEVFARQPADVREFMLASAVLRELTPQACDAICHTEDQVEMDSQLRTSPSSAAMLAYLRRQELFVIDLSSTQSSHHSGSEILDGSSGTGSHTLRLRYHHIFHSFLNQQSSPEQRRQWHLRAAEFFVQKLLLDETSYHLLQAGAMDKLAALLVEYGTQLLSIGRLDTLAAYLGVLPPVILLQHPMLLHHLGDLARLRSRFQEALGWYQQAESVWRERGQVEYVSRALRGQARVYLDTVNPSRAEELLQQSVRLSDGAEDRETQARLYELLSENRLNSGQVEEAERLRERAENLRSEGPSGSQLLFRVLLRTGRLEEARQKLEERAEMERYQPVQTPRAHRETLLLLSLIYAFQGLGEESLLTAQEGTRRGEDLNSPYVIAVGQMRQGHALMLASNDWGRFPSPEALADRYSHACQQFEKTVESSRTLSIPRLRVEAYWGLCRAYGYQGNLPQALKYAQEGIEIASQAGDEWIASLLRLAMGASLNLAGRYEAGEEWLGRAGQGFQECSDPFGYCAVRLWQSLGWALQKNLNRLSQILPDLLSACRAQAYDYLLTRPTLLGPSDNRLLVPLLMTARDHGWEADYASQLLKTIGLPDIVFHPGYDLRVITLGGFQVWRGQEAIPAGGWRREKARQLFQLLLSYRQSPLDRDQIIEYLWPGMDPETAQRNFKVTLNTLYHVLEPEREPGTESAFISRAGTTYRIRPEADLWFDAQIFSESIQNSQPIQDTGSERTMLKLEQVLSLYGGEYLPESRYETWSAAERERLAVLFLRTADRLCEHYLQTGRLADSIVLCQRILSYDGCWERAYRHLMIAYDRLGDHGQVARTYQRCVKALSEELEVAPATETEKLYSELVHTGEV